MRASNLNMLGGDECLIQSCLIVNPLMILDYTPLIVY